jgi:hypothetical protein
VLHLATFRLRPGVHGRIIFARCWVRHGRFKALIQPGSERVVVKSIVSSKSFVPSKANDVQNPNAIDQALQWSVDRVAGSRVLWRGLRLEHGDFCLSGSGARRETHRVLTRLARGRERNLVNQKCVLGLGPVAYCSAAHTFKRNRRQIQLMPTKSNGIHDDIAAYNYMTAARSTQD